MPIYAKSVTAPKNTLASSPITNSFFVSAGNLERIQILIPSGHAGLTNTSLHYLSRQIFPTNDDLKFIGDDIFLKFTPNMFIIEDPLVLTIEFYNLDDLYEHTVYMWLEIDNIKKQELSNLILPTPLI